MMDLEQLYGAERARLADISRDASAPQADYLHPVFGDGNSEAILMIVGEAPGKEEALAGKPFVGKAGKQLDEFLDRAGIDRRLTFVTNAVKYRPVNRKEKSVSNRTPGKGEILDSLYVLQREIELLKPKIIATFGNTPLFAIKQLAGEAVPDKTIGELHGQPFRFEYAGETLCLFPMYHPASVIYNRSLKPVLQEDSLSLAKLTLSMK